MSALQATRYPPSQSSSQRGHTHTKSTVPYFQHIITLTFKTKNNCHLNGEQDPPKKNNKNAVRYMVSCKMATAACLHAVTIYLIIMSSKKAHDKPPCFLPWGHGDILLHSFPKNKYARSRLIRLCIARLISTQKESFSMGRGQRIISRGIWGKLMSHEPCIRVMNYIHAS